MLKLLLSILLASVPYSSVHSQTFFDPHVAADMIARNEAVLIDVREAEEIAPGRAEPALWFPTSKIKEAGPELEDFLSSLDADKTIIVYCGTGRRAAYFVSLLRERGFAAENLGGFQAWVDAGLPLRKG